MTLTASYKLGERIVSIRRGDPSAISEIYSFVGNAMLAAAYVYVGNYEDAEDVVQDALLVIVRKAAKYRTDKNAKAWINTIIRDLSKNKVKSRKRQRGNFAVAQQDLSSAPDVSEPAINKILAVLSEREKQFLIYRYWYKCSFTEMGEIFHRSKAYIYRTLIKFENKLKNL